MSEEQNVAASPRAYSGPVDDLYLHVLLDTMDEPEAANSAISITLMVGGTLVCGEMISHTRWQNELQQLLHASGEGAAALGRLFKAIDEQSGPRAEDEPLNFLHLRNVLTITNYRGTLQGDVPQGLQHPLWRARISDVEGWSLGRPE